MLNIKNLIGGWGPTIIVEDVSLSVAEGETLAIVGRNGVGKTTLLELIVGRAARRSGRILLHGVDIEESKLHRRSQLGVGHVPQQREVFASLTVEEHLNIATRPGEWNRSRVLDLFPSLGNRLQNLGSQLSGGEQQMLAISRALVSNPCLLLMDEPSEGLAPVVIDQLVHAMKLLTADKSLSIVLVEQRIDIAIQLADRFLVMDRGQIVREVDSEMLQDPTVVAEFIGLTHSAEASAK